MNGISAFIKETPESLLARFYFVRAQVGSMQPGEGPSLRHVSALILDLDFPDL